MAQRQVKRVKCKECGRYVDCKCRKLGQRVPTEKNISSYLESSLKRFETFDFYLGYFPRNGRVPPKDAS